MGTSQEDYRRAVACLEEGVAAGQGGDLDRAAALYNEGLNYHPPLDLEVQLRRNIVINRLKPLFLLSEDTELSNDQASRFEEGEKNLQRLFEILQSCRSGGLGLDADEIKDLDRFVSTFGSFVYLSSCGRLIFPGDDGLHRLVSFGQDVANSAKGDREEKSRAADIFLKALKRLDRNKPEHREMLITAATRASTCLADCGRIKESSKCAEIVYPLIDHADMRMLLRTNIERAAGRTVEEATSIASSEYVTERDGAKAAGGKTGCLTLSLVTVAVFILNIYMLFVHN